MSFDVGSSTAGMMNNKVNLFDKAVALSKDGKLSKDDIKKLEQTAKSDGNYTGVERVFIDDLKSDGGASTFAHFSKGANFDPKAFNWNVMEAKTSVTSAAGHKIELEFSDAPIASKQVKGDIEQSKADIEALIPADKKADWQKVDKHNVSQVKNFLDGLNLSPNDKVKFVESYMTAHFNHPGVNIKWGGAGLQEGIDTVPKDDNGRKYLDCEGYAKLSETLLSGSGNFTTLGVASGSNGDKRDHQIAVYREGNDAFVISNNEIKKVPGGATKSDEDLVKETYPDFKNIIVDGNGAMKMDTSEYSVGDTLNNDNGSTIQINSIDSATQMSGVLDNGPGNKFHVKVTINEDDGSYTSSPDFQAGDVVTTSTGVVINFNGPNAGVATFPDGTTRPVTATIDASGTPTFH